jgi:hypothetical protein
MALLLRGKFIKEKILEHFHWYPQNSSIHPFLCHVKIKVFFLGLIYFRDFKLFKGTVCPLHPVSTNTMNYTIQNSNSRLRNELKTLLKCNGSHVY